MFRISPCLWPWVSESDDIAILFQPAVAGNVPTRGFVNCHTRWCMSQSSPTRTEFIAGKLKTVIDAIIADKELSSLLQPLFILASVNVNFLK